MTNQALILAGDPVYRPDARHHPSSWPMADINGRPFLEYLVWNLQRHGITNILFTAGRFADEIQAHFGDGSEFAVTIEYFIEHEAVGTGGGVKLAQEGLSEEFFVLKGNSLFDLNFLDLALVQRNVGALASLALRKTRGITEHRTLTIENSLITGFHGKKHSRPGLVSGGVYFMKKEAIARMGELPFSLEDHFFPALAEKGLLSGKEFNSYFIDIGTPERLEAAQQEVPARQTKPAVFFDRDGVVNVDHGYVHTADAFTWTAGAQEAIKLCNDLGWYVFIVTNQSGIGRGYYSEEKFLEFTRWINEELRKHGAHIDQTFFCPHHPTEAIGDYKRSCPCRKPAPGMLYQAFSQWPIDRDNSFMIGDKKSDMQAAQAGGVKGILFEGGNLHHTLQTALEKHSPKPR